MQAHHPIIVCPFCGQPNRSPFGVTEGGPVAIIESDMQCGRCRRMFRMPDMHLTVKQGVLQVLGEREYQAAEIAELRAQLARALDESKRLRAPLARRRAVIAQLRQENAELAERVEELSVKVSSKKFWRIIGVLLLVLGGVNDAVGVSQAATASWDTIVEVADRIIPGDG